MFFCLVLWPAFALHDAPGTRAERVPTPDPRNRSQVLPTRCGIPWLGFVVYPTHRLIKRRNAVKFTRRFERNLDAYRAGRISFAEFDAGVQGWINHVRYGDTRGLREHLFSGHPIPRREC